MLFLDKRSYRRQGLPVPPCPKCGKEIVWGFVNWGCGQEWEGWTCSYRHGGDDECSWQETDEWDFDWKTRWYSSAIAADIKDPAGIYIDYFQLIKKQLRQKEAQKDGPSSN